MKKTLNLILCGPPGSGKGTQSKRIAKRYGLLHVSTGDLLREEIEKKTPLGVEVKSILDKGTFVPDPVMLELIRGVFTAPWRSDKGILLDGYPRTIPQAEGLRALLAELHESLDLVVNLVVPESVIIGRVEKRAREEDRTDDTLGALRVRLAEFRDKTAPTIASYRGGSVPIVDIDGTVDMDGVERQIVRAIDHRQFEERRSGRRELSAEEA